MAGSTTFQRDVGAIVRILAERGMTREQRLTVLAEYVQRPIGTTFDLRPDEAAIISELLQKGP